MIVIVNRIVDKILKHQPSRDVKASMASENVTASMASNGDSEFVKSFRSNQDFEVKEDDSRQSSSLNPEQLDEMDDAIAGTIFNY
jgi:hypothetical protein